MEEKLDKQRQNQKDQDEARLYKKASQRAGFKIHLAIFILGNLLLWVLWYFLIRGGQDATSAKITNVFIFISIIWLIVLIFHYLFVYQWNKAMVEKELGKLKRELKEKEEELKKLKEESTEIIDQK